MYGKIFETTFTGSMMGAGADVFSIWSYAIANVKPCKENTIGVVELNPALLAALIGMTAERAETAIRFLEAPDPYSRSQKEDGRRIVREGQFLYRIVNYGEYRKVRDAEERREYQREWDRKNRKRKLSESDNVRHHPTNPTQAEAEVEVKDLKLSLRESLSHDDSQTDSPNKSEPKSQAKPKPEEPKPKKSEPDPRVSRLQKYFAQEYERRFKAKYLPAYGRDGKIFKDILAGLHSMNGDAEAHVQAVIKRYLAPDHKFKGNLDVPSFLGAFNRLAAEMPKSATGPPRPAILDRPAPTDEQWETGKRKAREALQKIGNEKCPQAKKNSNLNSS